MLSRNDYKVLIFLYKYGCVNEMKSMTIHGLAKSTNLSVSKIRKTLYVFKEMGYINEGVVQHNAKTYYISDEGFNKVITLV